MVPSKCTCPVYPWLSTTVDALTYTVQMSFSPQGLENYRDRKVGADAP